MEHISQHLRLSNSEPRHQELQNSKSSDEQIDFEIALENEKIINTSVERLKEVFRLVMLKIGLRSANIPQDEEKFILVQHIIQHYGGHTPEEILLAFDMAIAGKLDVEVNCYENFSCLYVSNIMNAYRSWAKDQHKQIKPVVMQIENKESLSDQSMLEWIEELKKEKRVDFMPLQVYDWLDRRGDLNYTNNQKNQALSLAAAHRRQQLIDQDSPKLPDFLKMFMERKYSDEEYDHLKNLAKKFLLMDFLNQPNT